MIAEEDRDVWRADCMKWLGEVLDPDGAYAHWCADWDDLPVDSSMDEFNCCTCYGQGALETKHDAN